MVLTLLCLPTFLSAQARPGLASTTNVQELQRQVIELSGRLDRTSYLITGILLLFMAMACFGLWWNARTFRAFRSVGLYLASVSCVFFVDYFPQTSSWERTFFALTTLLWPEMVADVLNIPKGRWIWLNRVPCVVALLPVSSPLLQPINRLTFDLSESMVAVLLFIAFRRGDPSDRLIRAALTLLWLTRVSLDPFVRRFVPTQFNLNGWHWNFGPLAMILFGAIAIALFVRELISDRQEKQRLVAELEAARGVQQVIVPEAIPIVPGFKLEGVYKPASEVGGDFFQIVATPAGGILAVIGDVSGKGMPAAMTVSLLVGTFRTIAHYTQSPSEILAAMNQCMLGRNKGGFTTCLAVRVDADGTVTVANAGHLDPYLNSAEFKAENGLPLGLAEASHTECKFGLEPGQQLTLLTDGVAEARYSSRELFGFDRTRNISGKSAEEIAHAAQAFGQEDDITVLTLTFAATEVLHA